MRRLVSILHIDDDATTRFAVRQYLQGHSYNVIEARNGHTGYNMAVIHQPNLILLDYHLPGLTGTQIATRLQSEPSTKNIPIVALTSTSEQEYPSMMIAGCVAFLEKPFHSKALLEIVRLFTRAVPQHPVYQPIRATAK
jgi:CheY-like chemotaxis protein